MRAPGKIGVLGATGRVGSHVVDVLDERGHDVVAMSRTTGVDVISGEGLADALTGVDCVVDTATGPSPDQDEAALFFTTAARNLHSFGARAGVGHIVVVSIIGCDLFQGGYSAAKFAHEQALRSGPIPVSILRAGQFHEFVAQLVEWGTQGDVCYVPTMRTQLVAARSVAEALTDLATDPAPTPSASSGVIPEIAGPREESLVEMARLLVARRDVDLRVEEVSDETDPDLALFTGGGLLPSPHATLAGPTFVEWLNAQAATPREEHR